MAKLLQDASAAGEDALSVARRLVEFAIGRGGQDNITAAVLRLE
jgi:serine/threonine protein phosphatase PrpC